MRISDWSSDVALPILSQGAVTATSSDAINGAQLYNTASGMVGVIGGGLAVDPATGAITGTPAFAIGGGGSKATVTEAFAAVGDELDNLNSAVNGVQIGRAHV